jgi:hypothetical protein
MSPTNHNDQPKPKISFTSYTLNASKTQKPKDFPKARPTASKEIFGKQKLSI